MIKPPLAKKHIFNWLFNLKNKFKGSIQYKMNFKKALILLSLMFSGECIFILPFLVTRIYRPTFLKVFDITNFELGTAFSVYGIVAAVSYFFGGPLADKFSPKKLMAFSLVATCLGGAAMSNIPSLPVLTVLYGLWGFSTILLFWAAFIKATRLLGGQENQGKSFGTVDAGRGFIAAALASCSVLLFDYFLKSPADTASLAELSQALGNIILLFSCLTAFSAILIWLFIPNTNEASTSSIHAYSLGHIKEVINRRPVWMQALIVLCAYVGYKCTDDFSLYASVVMGYNDVDAAHVGTISFWVRPFAAIAAGFIGDRFIHSKVIALCFFIIIIGSLFISSGLINNSLELYILITIASISVGIYGLRGLYFALFEEAGLPIYLTGSAVGVVSVLGYTPDIFFGPLMGYVLDRSPGLSGHQHLFAILFVFAAIGFIISIYFNKNPKQRLNN